MLTIQWTLTCLVVWKSDLSLLPLQTQIPNPPSSPKNGASHGSTLLSSCRRHESLCHSKAGAHGGHFGHGTHRLERDETCLAHVCLSKKIDKPCTATEGQNSELFDGKNVWNKNPLTNTREFCFYSSVGSSTFSCAQRDPPKYWHSPSSSGRMMVASRLLSFLGGPSNFSGANS